ncbi:hypothetical protein [Streptomyces sp. NPDC050145]|uniref:hypothetical protein n=1 Tax=Streptomyces sp. NPDC050145 TaxID=3365602 RepID=UPI0037B98AE8
MTAEIVLPVHLRIGDSECRLGTVTLEAQQPIGHDVAEFLRAAADAYERATLDQDDRPDPHP